MFRKAELLAWLTLTLLSQEAVSQLPGDKCGVYATWEGLQLNSPLIEIPCGQQGFAIWPAGFWRHRGIDVILQDTTLHLESQNIWGYRDHKGRLHRFRGKRHLRVEKHPGFVSYTCTSPILPRRYFSKKLNSEIHSLTSRKLRQVLVMEPVLAEKVHGPTSEKSHTQPGLN